MQKSDYRNMWVYIEHDGVTAASVGLELCCELRKLCDTTGDRLYAVILGNLPESEAEKVKDCGIDGLICVSGRGYEYFNTDAYTNAFTVLSRKYNPSAIFVGGTINGRDFAPRFAVQLETGCTSDAMELEYDPETGDIQFIEPADDGGDHGAGDAPPGGHHPSGHLQICSDREKGGYRDHSRAHQL